MPNAMCSVEECARPAHARGWCTMHYTRWRAHGDPHAVKFVRGDDAARFWSYVVRLGTDECWTWTGASTDGRYGFFSVAEQGKRRHMTAHRFAYELLVGPIPPGLVLDHFACDNPRCVNPAHLKAVVQRDNALRSKTGPSAVNSRKTHCVNGHEFTEVNTRPTRSGSRSCRACARETQWRRRRARGDKQRKPGPSPRTQVA